MTAANDHREPLDDDERDLAARLARVGPFGEPSPSLDARILAAAHAAAATRAPGTRRRLAWIGVPPALVTGIGVAAAAVLALGLVWQLQPRTGLLVSGDEAGPGDEMFVLAEPSAARRARAVNPPPLSAPPPPPAQSALLAPSATTRVESGKVGVAAPTEAKASPAAPAASAAAAITDAADDAPAPAEVPQAAVPEATTWAAPAEAAIKEEPGFVATPPRVPSVLARKQSRASHAPAAQAASPPREPALSAAPVREAQPADREQDGATLDRVGATGVEVAETRLRRAEVASNDRPLSEVPVTDDVRLDPGQWLARVRARRDDDDLDGARASLRLFHHEYPRVRIPGDLRALLGDPGQ